MLSRDTILPEVDKVLGTIVKVCCKKNATGVTKMPFACQSVNASNLPFYGPLRVRHIDPETAIYPITLRAPDSAVFVCLAINDDYDSCNA